ncbi:MAG: phage terminase large subunit [Alphaproteobacteria bacterium]|nr:phage terminase large subunit [Alphaproteobacteria bacterium]
MAVDATEEEQRFVAKYLAREDFYFFVRWMFLQRRGYKWLRASHHQIICNALMRVYRGECTRLIINIPPRYSKTELAVVNWIAWCLGKHPDSEFIHVSYSAMLAINNSAQIRDLICHEAYMDIFPTVMLKGDTNAKDHWKTTDGGVMYATGAGGTITGFGAGKQRDGFGGAILIDDPHKADEASSDVIRSGVIDWFQNTLESRKNDPKRTPIIVVMQRLHERDLAGWLLDGGNGEQWEHVCLPALQDDGTALWPEKHSIEQLLKMEQAAPYHFAGQYQQRPSARQGNFYQPDRINIVEAIPPGIRWIRGWDFAATAPRAGSDPDYTVGIKLGVSQDGRYWIGDMSRLRGLPDEVERALLNAAQRDGREAKQSIPQDPGQAGKAQVAAFTRLLAGFSVMSSPESGDKETRAGPFAAQVNIGNVNMIRAEWNDAVINELRMFPNGAHDDISDAAARAFNSLHGGNEGIIGFYKSLGLQ